MEPVGGGSLHGLEDENIGMIPWNASLHLANKRETDIHDHIARQAKREQVMELLLLVITRINIKKEEQKKKQLLRR